MKKILFIVLLFGSLATWAAPPRGIRYHAADSLHAMYVEAYNQTLMNAMQASPRRVGTPLQTPVPRVLVIMVNFSDFSFTRTREEVDSVFNAEHLITPDMGFDANGYPVIRSYSETGSVRKYFYDQSEGKYNPQFDVVGPVTLSKGYGYYGQNYNSNSTRYAGEMVAEACALVDGNVNFADYDANSDGKVDMVFIYYAGFGENDPPYEGDYPDINANNLAWPHYHVLSSAGTNGRGKVFDGKTVEAYECANELDGLYSMPGQEVPAGIGVLVHEFCHGLGLPDLYKTGSGTHKTLGQWSVLDYGPYNNGMRSPAAMTAYERWFMGWLSPKHLNQQANVTLAPLSEKNEAAYLTADGGAIRNIVSPGTTPFYIVENRQQTGWDVGLPGEGLLLYKISYSSSKWTSNAVNNTATAMGVDILEADGLAPAYNTKNPDNGFYGKQGDCYPYNNQNITVAANYPITAITQNANGTISFRVAGGYDSYGVTVEQSVAGLAEVEAEPAPSGLYLYDATYGYGATITVNDGYTLDSIVITTSAGATLVEDEDYLYEDGYLYILSVTDELSVHLYGQATPTGVKTTTTTTQTQKVLINGTLYVLKDGEWYDVLGRKH